MNLPFSREAFFAVFADYNDAVWPMPLLWLSIGIAAAALTTTRQPLKGRAIAAALAVLWAWMGLVVEPEYASRVDPSAWWFGALFTVGAMAFAWFGVWHDGLRFDAAPPARGGLARARHLVGWGLMLFALFVYPMVGLAFGQRFPAAATFGLPCPTTLYTLGILLLAGPTVPRVLFAVPLVWALAGALAAFVLGVPQDLVLLPAAVLALFVMRAAALPPRSASAKP